MKAVVVDIKDEYAAVLSDDGSIVKVKNKRYSKGQVIEMKTKKVHFTKKLALGVASAAVLILGSSVGAWAYTTPYFYVSLDVNPSIEYTLNRFDRVIDIKAVNDDGQVILDKIDIKDLNNQSIEDAITDTVKQISQDGYFDGDLTNAVTGSAIQIGDDTKPVVKIDGGIVITVANGNTEISDELVKEIRESVEDFVDENVKSEDVEVEVSSVGYERVQKARELGVTPGKLNLVEKLQASAADPDSIVLEDWLKKPVKDIMKAIKENRKANPVTGNEDSAESTETSESTETTDTTETTEATETVIADDSESASTSDGNTVEDTDKDVKKVKDKQEKAISKQQKADEKAVTKQKRNIAKQEKAEEKSIKKQEKAVVKQQNADEKATVKQNKADEKAKTKNENKLNSSKSADNANKNKNKK
jgi:hypothetical protein